MPLISPRRIAVSAFALTLLALLIMLVRAPFEQSLLRDVNLGSVAVVYAALLVGLAGVIFFAPRLQTIFADSRAHFGIIALAFAVSVGINWLLPPIEEVRLAQFPFTLWVIILHAVGVAVLLIVFARTGNPQNDVRTSSLLVGFMAAALVIFVLLYIVVIGEFMLLDLPDEPWLTSMATNFAENGDLSPSYIASPYGQPDPILPRYYLLMGLWIKIAGSSLVAMRLFSLAVGLFAAGLLFWLMRRVWAFHWPNALIGLLALLGLSAFLRASHSLRMDVGLAVYSVLMLWGLLAHFDGRKPCRTALLTGLALLVGLETVPTVALPLGAAAGFIMIVHCLIDGWRSHWLAVVTYALGCAAAAVVYLALHLLPDVSASLDGFQRFNALYADRTSLGQIRLPIDSFVNYHLRFSFALSPIEFLLIVVAVGGLVRGGSASERWLLLVFGLALLVTLTLISVTYGYWALYAPLAAYAIARLPRNQTQTLIVTLVLLPALLIPPARDLTTALTRQPNHAQLQVVEPIVAQIPPDVRVIGDPIFWFGLQNDHTFMGWTAISRYGHANGLSGVDSLKALNPDIAICSQDVFCDMAMESGLYAPPEEITAHDTRYLIFRRS